MATYYSGYSRNSRIYVTVTNSGTSIPNNTSVVNWAIYLQTTSYTFSGAVQSGGLTINGVNVWSAPSSYSALTANHTYTLGSGSLTVAHNSDGKKSVSVAASFSSNSGGYGPVGLSISESFALDTIPRASSITSLTGSTIGSSMTVNISRATTSFTHQVWYRLPGQAWQDLGTGHGTTCAFTIPVSSSSYLPSSTSGDVEIAIQTKSGSANIGGEVRKKFSVSVPSSVVPSFSSLSTYDANSIARNTVGAFVQHKSQVQVSINSASGTYGSTIKSYRITGGGLNSYSSTGTVNPIQVSDSVTFTGTITDSRGRTASKTTTINVLPYTAPKVDDLLFVRSNSSGKRDPMGAYVNVVAKVTVADLEVGSTQKNTNKLETQYKTTTSGTWLDRPTQTSSALVKTYSSIYSGFSIQYAYNFRVRIGDVFGLSGYVAGLVPTGAVTQHWGSETTAFGKLIDSTNYNVLVGNKGLHSDGPIYSSGGLVYPNSYADTRSVNNTPEWYQTNKRLQVTREFKQKSVTGPSSAVGTYIDLSTHVFYADQSGGPVKQVAIDDNGNVYTRTGRGVSWGNWTRVARSDEIPTVPANGGITSGGSQNSRWIKYPDGTQICYGRVVSNNAITVAIGSGFRQGGVGVGFPANFTEVPSVTVTASNYALASLSSVTTTGFNYLLISLDSGRIAGWVIWQAIGRWK